MEILSASYIKSSPDYTHCPVPDRPEYAFIGRSNVGKSSLINMLCNQEKLAKTSHTPGKTQLINHFAVRSTVLDNNDSKDLSAEWYIADLPGYGYAKVSQSQRAKWAKIVRDYLVKRPNLMCAFLLIDSRHNPQQIDLSFANKLGAWEVPFFLIFTKSDKESMRQVSAHVKAFLDQMRTSWQVLPDYTVTSSLKKTGRKKILEWVALTNERFRQFQIGVEKPRSGSGKSAG